MNGPQARAPSFLILRKLILSQWRVCMAMCVCMCVHGSGVCTHVCLRLSKTLRCISMYEKCYINKV